MNIDYQTKNFQLSDKMQGYIEGLLDKASRFFEDPIEIRVTLEEANGHRFITDVHASHRHGSFQSNYEAEHMYDAIHHAVLRLEKQARRSRKKFIGQRRRADRHVTEDLHWPVDVLHRETFQKEAEVTEERVVESTRLPIQTLLVEDAVERLESESRQFLVFRDSESGEVNVLYQRAEDGHYGLLRTEG
ncbi:MAG: ribosome-associated translation inhibitor RaiA [Acidobacteriota bacterium]